MVRGDDSYDSPGFPEGDGAAPSSSAAWMWGTPLPIGAKAPHRRAGTGAMTTGATGLVIIRAWVDQESSEPLRAQVRFSRDVSAGFDRTLAFTRAENVAAVVQEWLTGMVSDAERPE